MNDAKPPITKTRKFLAIVILCVVAPATAILDSALHRFFDAIHEIYAEEEIHYSVATEYHALTASHILGKALYPHFQNAVASSQEWAYQRALGKIPEDDDIRLLLDYYAHFRTKIHLEAKLEGSSIAPEELLNFYKKLIHAQSKSDVFMKRTRFRIMLEIMDYVLDKQHLLQQGYYPFYIEKLVTLSIDEFKKTNPNDLTLRKYESYKNSARHFPLKISFCHYHIALRLFGGQCIKCKKNTCTICLRAYNRNVHALIDSLITDVSEEEHSYIEAVSKSCGNLKSSLSKALKEACNIELSTLESSYERFK